MERLTLLAFLVTLVGVAAVAIAVSPLVVFLAEYNAGRVGVYVEELGGGYFRVVVEYNITVPLRDFTLKVKALRGGEAFYEASTGDPSLEAGETLALIIDANAIAEADTVVVEAAGSIAALYPFNFTVVVPAEELVGVYQP